MRRTESPLRKRFSRLPYGIWLSSRCRSPKDPRMLIRNLGHNHQSKICNKRRWLTQDLLSQCLEIKVTQYQSRKEAGSVHASRSTVDHLTFGQTSSVNVILALFPFIFDPFSITPGICNEVRFGYKILVAPSVRSYRGSHFVSICGVSKNTADWRLTTLSSNICTHVHWLYYHPRICHFHVASYARMRRNRTHWDCTPASNVSLLAVLETDIWSNTSERQDTAWPSMFDIIRFYVPSAAIMSMIPTSILLCLSRRPMP